MGLDQHYCYYSSHMTEPRWLYLSSLWSISSPVLASHLQSSWETTWLSHEQESSCLPTSGLTHSGIAIFINTSQHFKNGLLSGRRGRSQPICCPSFFLEGRGEKSNSVFQITRDIIPNKLQCHVLKTWSGNNNYKPLLVHMTNISLKGGATSKS